MMQNPQCNWLDGVNVTENQFDGGVLRRKVESNLRYNQWIGYTKVFVSHLNIDNGINTTVLTS